MIQDFIKKVGEFHDAFGVQRENVDVELRYKLFKEEFEEYLEGYNAYLQNLEYFTNKKGEYVHTFTYMVDAICDMLYIASGTADLSKCILFKETIYKNQSRESTLKLISKYSDLYNKNPSSFYLHNLIDEVFTLAYIDKVHKLLPQLFEEVHLSNLSKLDENGKPIINDGILDPSKPIGKILKGKNYFEPRLKEILEDGH